MLFHEYYSFHGREMRYFSAVSDKYKVLPIQKKIPMSDETLREMQKPKSLLLEIIERLTTVETQLES